MALRGSFTSGQLDAAVSFTSTVAGSVAVAYTYDSRYPATGSMLQGPGTALTIGGSLQVGYYWTHVGNGGVYSMGDGSSLTLTGTESDLWVAYGHNARGTFTGDGDQKWPESSSRR